MEAMKDDLPGIGGDLAVEISRQLLDADQRVPIHTENCAVPKSSKFWN